MSLLRLEGPDEDVVKRFAATAIAKLDTLARKTEGADNADDDGDDRDAGGIHAGCQTINDGGGRSHDRLVGNALGWFELG